MPTGVMTSPEEATLIQRLQQVELGLASLHMQKQGVLLSTLLTCQCHHCQPHFTAFYRLPIWLP